MDEAEENHVKHWVHVKLRVNDSNPNCWSSNSIVPFRDFIDGDSPILTCDHHLEDDRQSGRLGAYENTAPHQKIRERIRL